MMNKILWMLIALLIMTLSKACAAVSCWKHVPAAQIVGDTASSDIYQLKEATLCASLQTAPTQYGTALMLDLPLPGKGLRSFYVWKTPAMEPALAERYPQIKTYTAVAVDDPATTSKLEYTPLGFSAMIFSPAGIYTIKPYETSTGKVYLARVQNLSFPAKYTCNIDALPEANLVAGSPEIIGGNNSHTAARSNGNVRHIYRLAMSCTGEYAHLLFANPTKAAVLSQIVATVNHMNGYYEREFALSMLLVAANDQLIYTDTATDPYSCNFATECLINEANNHVKSTIGIANFDIGFTLCTAGGGLGALGALCNANGKAAGVGYSSGPDDIAVIIHEMAHQFNAPHTFNANTAGCLNNADSANAYEPGAGISIMSYAGGCDPNSVGEKEPFYHVSTLLRVADHIASQPATCGSVLTSSRTVNVPGITDTFFCIPQNTPFELTAPDVVHDANTALLYNWEQWDLGNFRSTESQNALANSGPLFRSYQPVASRLRPYPSYSNIINGVYGEGLGGAGQRITKKERDIHFKLTVRSIYQGWGNYYITDQPVHIRTARTATAFRAMSPQQDVVWTPGQPQQITWNTGGAESDTVKCGWVNLYLSLDDGVTFPLLLVSNVPNTGSYLLTAPNVATTTGRIKIKASGGIFFDIAKGRITINGSTGLTTPLVIPEEVLVFPNPARHWFTIQDNIPMRLLQTTVCNALGQRIWTGEISGDRNIDATTWAPGVYWIQLWDEVHGKMYTRKLVLQ